MLKTLLLYAGLLLAATAAHADHHSWRFAELFSVPDGSVQFIEMRATSNGHDQLAGETIVSGTTAFTFPNDLPNPATANARILLATPAFAALPGAPAPDFTIPAGFLGPPGETLSYSGTLDALSLPALPTDGVTSWNRGSPPFVQPNSPTTFAGATGSVYVAFCGNGTLDPGEACDAGLEGSICCSAACVAASAGVTCSDGDLCTVSDTCDGAGACVGSGVLACDDANPCTTDACVPAVGCANAPVADATPCDDASVCSQASACVGGQCIGSDPIVCDDGNSCTTNACDPTLGCVFPPADFVPCDDGSVCTVGDVCFGGACVAGPPADCADGNACTDDLCDPVLGCQNPANTAPCVDGNVCTLGDVCAGGSCQPGGGALDCDDADPCTAESCDAIVGCINEPIPGCVAPPEVPTNSLATRFILLALLVLVASGVALRGESARA